MGALFDYFASHSIENYDILEIIKLAKCETEESFKKQFKLYVETLLSNTRTDNKVKNAQRFAMDIESRNFDMLKSRTYYNYWLQQERRSTRSITERTIQRFVLNQAALQFDIVSSIGNDNVDSLSPNTVPAVSAPAPAPAPKIVSALNTVSTPNAAPTNAVSASRTQAQAFLDTSDDDTSFSSGDDMDFNLTAKQPSPLYYLICNEGDYTFNLDKTSTMWILDNTFNVSEVFVSFRNKCLSKAEDLESLTLSEELAVNGIMLIDDRFAEQRYIPFNYVENLLEESSSFDFFRSGKLLEHEKELVDLLVENAKKLTCNISTLEVIINSWIQKYIDKQPLQFAMMSTMLCNIFCSGSSSNRISNEATLVRDSIDPFFHMYLKNNPLYQAISADKVIKPSRKRFVGMDPALYNQGKRVDFSLVSCFSNDLLFTLEAKSRSSKNSYDFMKLARELKDSIRSMNDNGFANVNSCGIVMEGPLCKSYIMDHRFDGLYRLILVDQFRLPTSRFEFSCLYDVIPAFKNIRTIVTDTAEKLSVDPPSSPTIPASIPSMHTPIKLDRSKKLNLNPSSPDVKNARRRLF